MAPGWYEDAADPLRKRYWDGEQWSTRMRYVDGSWQPEPEGAVAGPPGQSRVATAPPDAEAAAALAHAGDLAVGTSSAHRRSSLVRRSLRRGGGRPANGD